MPVSVLIGFALLPFAIPLLWLIGPALLSQQPSLSLAAPASLALSAAVLCLAVVFTVDWTPATRIKGVLMLVGLSYFAGLSLYFLKKDMVDRARELFGTRHHTHIFHPVPEGGYEVRLPVKPNEVHPVGDQPVPGGKLRCFQATFQEFGEQAVVLTVGAGTDPHPELRKDDPWYDAIGPAMVEAAGVAPQAPSMRIEFPPGRAWELMLPNDSRRIVRIYRVGGKVFYLSAEGPSLDETNPHVRQFFDSFRVVTKPGQ